MSQAVVHEPRPGPATERVIAQSQIGALLDQLAHVYRKTNGERAKLTEQRLPFDGSRLHGEIEIFVDDIAGYADSIASRGTLKQPFKAIRWLLTAHGMPLIAQLRRGRFRYPRLEQYVFQADHLRRLVIEYIERYSQ